MNDAITRLRRLRGSANLRQMLERVTIEPHHVIVPLFVCEGTGVRNPIGKMPGINQMSIDVAIPWLAARHAEGFRSCILFGVVETSKKDAQGSVALDENNIVCQTIRAIRERGIDMVIFTDLCFCQYTNHGHCGVLSTDGTSIENDATLDLLVRQAVNHAKAGAEFIAPSGMMDGMIATLRHGLDAAGFQQVGLLSYAVKYASAFYGPFRDAAGSAPAFGDRRTYQMDIARGIDEALHETRIDLDEGADMVMVKPAGPCLDIISAVRGQTRVPVVAYQTSGEYAMYEAAGGNGWIDRNAAVREGLLAIRRAGADLVISYYTEQLAEILKR